LKTPWEARVGILLDSSHHSEFVYSYKPYDSPHYGGQPRIDWHACDIVGRYWMIEVKSLPSTRQSINMVNDVSAGQAQALDAIVKSGVGVALVAVGRGNTLYVFDWREIGECRNSVKSAAVKMGQSFLTLPWSPKSWREFSLYETVMNRYRASLLTPSRTSAPPMAGMAGTTAPAAGSTPPMPGPTPATVTNYEAPSPETPAPPSPSISKRTSAREKRRKLLANLPSPGF